MSKDEIFHVLQGNSVLDNKEGGWWERGFIFIVWSEASGRVLSSDMFNSFTALISNVRDLAHCGVK
jgi:hypothetical protein